MMDRNELYKLSKIIYYEEIFLTFYSKIFLHFVLLSSFTLQEHSPLQMSLKSISEWQQCSKKDQTRILNTLGTFNCGKCTREHRSNNSVEHTMVVCSSGGSVDFFCSGCWDEEEWTCPGCNQVPADAEVIGCEHCGQWTHNNCQQVIDISRGYICFDCRTSDPKTLKETIFDKQAALTEVVGAFAAVKQKYASVVQAQQHTETQLHQTEATLVKFQKANVANATKFKTRMNSQRQQFDVVSTQMNAELAKLRHRQQHFQTEFVKLQKKKQRLASSAIVLKKNNANLSGQVERLRKRNRDHESMVRDHDSMVEMMQSYVKRHKNNWSYTPPSGLSAHDVMLWNLYQCKVRSNNNTMFYSANKMSSKEGNSVEFNSLTKILQVARKVYSNKM